MIPESFIQDLLGRTEIVDLIDAYVPLKKAGANFSACCPFHSEKSPSFTVSPSKQFYHCFGCGAHGSAIGFLMQFSGMEFVDAIKDLAQRAGMQVPIESGHRAETSEHSHDLRQLMASAARFYREQLKSSPLAITYLKQRGLTGEVAARYGIGYAPEGWQNLATVFPRYDAPELLTAGLLIRNENGRLYDRFRDRIMFPIQNPQGDVIAFGGRVLGEGEPKYLNSPETPLFEKGRELFGLPQARQSLRQTDTAIVVEGYMDVVGLAQYGVENAVATLGTATTPTHIQKLLRQVDRVVFCFDGDKAGQKAAWRALENALEAASDSKVIAFSFLPSEHDPDSYVRALGAAAFQSFIKEAMPLSEYLIQEMTRRTPPDSAEGRSRLLHDSKPLLTQLKAPGLRLQIVKRLAELSGVTPSEVERLTDLRPIAHPVYAARRAPRAAPSLTKKIGALLLRRPRLAAEIMADTLPREGQEADALRELHAHMQQRAPHAHSIAPLLESLRSHPHAYWIEQLAAEVMTHAMSEEEIDSEWSDLQGNLQKKTLDAELAELSSKARNSGLSSHEKTRLMDLLRQKAGKT